MGFSQFPSTPAVEASKADFIFFFSGLLSTFQNNLIPMTARTEDQEVDQLDAYVQVAPTGDDLVVDFLVDGVSIGTVTILDGETDGTAALEPAVTITAGQVVTIEITQVGSQYCGKTLTAIARIA